MNGPEYTYNRRIESHGRTIWKLLLIAFVLAIGLIVAGRDLVRLERRIEALESKDRP